MSIRTLRHASTVAVVAAVALASACSGGTGAGSGSSDGTNKAAATRTVTHALGTAKVPAAPKRVVTFDQNLTLPTALMLGVHVVGSVVPTFGDPFPPYLDATETKGIENVGWWTDPNVEKIAALRPDLIIGQDTTVKNAYDKLSKIAPTVAVKRDPVHWQDDVKAVADALGKASEITDELATFDQRAARLKGQLASAGVTAGPVTLLNIRSTDDLRVYTTNCAAGALSQVGISLTLAGKNQADQQYVKLSVERLPQADAGYLFYFVGSTGTNPQDAKKAFAQVDSEPLWGQMRAVRSGHAYSVNPAWWFECGSVQATNRILDDVQHDLLGQ